MRVTTLVDATIAELPAEVFSGELEVPKVDLTQWRGGLPAQRAD
jgi:hypothetical protein